MLAVDAYVLRSGNFLCLMKTKNTATSKSIDNGVEILAGDNRAILPQLKAASVQCCVTSPPYWGLRDYDHIA